MAVEVLKVEDLGEHVYCDSCNDDYMGREDSGGILFGSKAYCPSCTRRLLPEILRFHEERHIKAVCPRGISYWKWVLSLRNGNNQVQYVTADDLDELLNYLQKPYEQPK